MHGKLTLAAGLALTAASLLATPVTRSDIEGMTFPATWDASGRSDYQYQVDVAGTAFETLDTFEFCVVEKAFDLDSTPLGFLLFLR